MRKSLLSLVSCAALAVATPAASQEATLAGGLVTIGEPTVLPDSVAPVEWIHSAMGSDGSMVLAYIHQNMIVKIAPDGTRLWTTGRDGEGPGEYVTLYRLAVDTEGRIAAYDLSKNRVSILSAEGDFIDRKPIEFVLRQIDTILWPDDTTLVIAGTADARGLSEASRQHGIHVAHATTDGFRYQGSFGPLPAAENRRVLDFWGAGVMSLSNSQGSMRLIYTVRNPYIVYVSGLDGSKYDSLTVDVPVHGTPDDRFEISNTPAFSIHSTDERVTTPVNSFEIKPGLFLGGRVDGPKRYWTLFDSDGTVLDDVEIPEWGGVIIGVDSDRGSLWMRSNIGGIAHLVSAELSVSDVGPVPLSGGDR